MTYYFVFLVLQAATPTMEDEIASPVAITTHSSGALSVKHFRFHRTNTLNTSLLNFEQIGTANIETCTYLCLKAMYQMFCISEDSCYLLDTEGINISSINVECYTIYWKFYNHE